jgi:hypothetical protein
MIKKRFDGWIEDYEKGIEVCPSLIDMEDLVDYTFVDEFDDEVWHWAYSCSGYDAEHVIAELILSDSPRLYECWCPLEWVTEQEAIIEAYKLMFSDV